GAVYDIHGNLPALEAVLHGIRGAAVDLIVVTSYPQAEDFAACSVLQPPSANETLAVPSNTEIGSSAWRAGKLLEGREVAVDRFVAVLTEMSHYSPLRAGQTPPGEHFEQRPRGRSSGSGRSPLILMAKMVVESGHSRPRGCGVENPLAQASRA
ncbi:MAG: hypothetical protein ABI647_17920, partial [Gemmatimonadota bacterium]